MKFIVNITKRGVIVLSILIVLVIATLYFAKSSVNLAYGFTPLQQISKTSSDLTSIDSNSNSVVDNAERASQALVSNDANRVTGKILYWETATNEICYDTTEPCTTKTDICTAISLFIWLAGQSSCSSSVCNSYCTSQVICDGWTAQCGTRPSDHRTSITYNRGDCQVPGACAPPPVCACACYLEFNTPYERAIFHADTKRCTSFT